MLRMVGVICAVALGLLAIAFTTPHGPVVSVAEPSPAVPTHQRAPTPSPAAPSLPLDGVAVVLDPGHQLGNSRHASSTNAAVPDGRGGTKACNTTGTATNSGYPEATFTWTIASLARASLEARGARVVLTRTSDSESLWGPCVDERGLVGNSLVDKRAVKVSIHADGSSPSGSGFHVITAPSGAPGTADLAAALHSSLAAEFPVANYIAGGDGLASRTDLATLNHSLIPTAMVELGNMRNASEAARMTSADGQAAYADALVAGICAYFQ